MKRNSQKSVVGGGASIASANAAGKNQKMQRLTAVFLKAMDVSISSIGREEVRQCFGTLAEKNGNIVEKCLINELERTRNALEKRFDQICTKRSVSAGLISLESSDRGRSGESSSAYDEPFAEYLEYVRSEKMRVLDSIERMKGSIVEVSQQVTKFRGQALEQVTDMEEEAKKLAMASEICSS